MPLVDGEQAVGGDGDDGGHRQARLGVGSNVGHRRVGRELEHHDDVLLHLLCEHQRGLQEKILFRVPAGTGRDGDEDGTVAMIGQEGQAGRPQYRRRTGRRRKRRRKKKRRSSWCLWGQKRGREEDYKVEAGQKTVNTEVQMKSDWTRRTDPSPLL